MTAVINWLLIVAMALLLVWPAEWMDGGVE